jgi:hypothetical protein
MSLVIARELEIYGSHGMAARDYPDMMRLVADGTLRPGLLVADMIGLEDVGEALAAMDGPAGAGMTVVSVHPLPGATGSRAGRTSRSWNCHRRRWTSTGSPCGPGMVNRSRKPRPAVYQDTVARMSLARSVANIGMP